MTTSITHSSDSSPDTSHLLSQSVRWTLPKEQEPETNLVKFASHLGFDSVEKLYDASIADVGPFWDSYLGYLGVHFAKPYHTILDTSEGPEFSKWCVGGELNIVDSCVTKWTKTKPTALAVLAADENGNEVKLTYSELEKEVNAIGWFLSEQGVQKGDRVAISMPQSAEMVCTFLAIIKLGAICVPLFTGYGVSAILARLDSCQSRFVVCTPVVWRRGKETDILDAIVKASDSCTADHKILCVGLAKPNDTQASQKPVVHYDSRLYKDRAITPSVTLPSETPLMIIYTSGTTGAPKGAVHTHVGFPIKAACDMQLCMDLKSHDTLSWISDIGWMMGPWAILGTLLCGATLALLDGAPDFPKRYRLWDFVDKHQISHLGISPVLMRSLMHQYRKEEFPYKLPSLRVLGSTGSPWDLESWKFTFEKILGGTRPILNYSGGTEISGGILCGNLLTGLKPCGFSGPVVGMDVEIFDSNGKAVTDQGVGELVIRKPWIGMTRGFWQAPEKYVETYWTKHPGVWTHGDFAAKDQEGTWYLLGRSDDTLKIAGKRVGPAEVESILLSHPSVREAAVIGVPHPLKDQEIVAYCVYQDALHDTLNASGESVGDVLSKLRKDLMDLIASELGKPLKPRDVVLVDSLPKTRNGKVMHRLIRNAYLNQPIGDVSSCENPEWFQKYQKSI